MSKEIDLKKLAQQVQLLQTELEHHISRQSFAHDPVSGRNNGFMSVDQFKLLNQVNGERKFYNFATNQNNDVLKMPEGKWYINDSYPFVAANLPESSGGWWLIDVSSSSDDRKDFVATKSSNDFRYHRTIHSGGSVTSGGGQWFQYGNPYEEKLTTQNLASGSIYAEVIEFGHSRLVSLYFADIVKNKAETELICTLPAYLIPNFAIAYETTSWENRNDEDAKAKILVTGSKGEISLNLGLGSTGKKIQGVVTYVSRRKR